MIDVQSTPVSVCPQCPATFNIAQAIEDHLPLVKKIARWAYFKFSRKFEEDDLVGYGHLGLVRAAHQYAAMEQVLRETTDFEVLAKKRIWGNIEVGRDQMAAIHRKHYYKIKHGKMSAPSFVRDSEEFSLADAITDSREKPVEEAIDAKDMASWLRDRNPLYAKVVELHDQGMTTEQMSALIGRAPQAAKFMYHRAVNMLRQKYNPTAFRPDDRTARRHRAASLASVLAEQVA